MVFELLQEIGIDLVAKAPRVVTPGMVSEAWRVVTFKCWDRCPAGTKEKSEEWPFPGSTGKTYAELRDIRDGIRGRVLRLIREISQNEHG